MGYDATTRRLTLPIPHGAGTDSTTNETVVAVEPPLLSVWARLAPLTW